MPFQPRAYLHSVIADPTGKRGAWLHPLLWLLSLGYACLSGLIRGLYLKGLFKRQTLGRPAISVGNLTWGGVGKTPLVLFLAESLAGRGKTPAVLTRGYGSRRAGGSGNGESDEVLLLRQALPGIPVEVGRDRARAAGNLLEKNPGVDIFLLDDGFQQWRVRRDLDIVVVDSGNPFGNGHLLPRGILREPLSSLKRADVVVLTKADLSGPGIYDLKDRVRLIHPSATVVVSVHRPRALAPLSGGPVVGLDALKGRRIAAFCGIGDPEGFRKTLEQQSAKVEKFFAFEDHHWYTPGDWELIAGGCREAGVEWLVTTSKDAVKVMQAPVPELKGLKIFELKITISITEGYDEFLRRVDHLLAR
ncbi:MAG: tetraacyldisaccharide 4'-kinase [Candidatus Omnitrophota bacterium]|nr:tetraacyldisaccharide 4'-kinase [Candidatus Omnitrophota bacterium]